MGRRRRPRTPAPIRATPTPRAQIDPGVDVGKMVRDEVSKALALPPGAVATPLAAGYLQTLAGRGQYPTTALPRDPYSGGAFGPGIPLLPAAISPPLESGRPAPKRWDFPQSWNLNTDTANKVPWTVLRDAADGVSVMRSCIEVRKSEITGLEWSFGINPTRARHLARRSGESPSSVAAALQSEYADTIERLTDWWTVPDRINQWQLPDWLNALVEDMLVIDACPIYPHLNYGGNLHAAELIDGTTVKPLLDWRGATPQSPQVAYQQILSGFPRGDYQASPAAIVANEFTRFDSVVYGRPNGTAVRTDSLLYKVKSRRTNTPYGFSCVEQALSDVDLYLKRMGWLGSEFDAGVTPEMLVNVEANLTPEQLRQYEAVFNDDLSGRSADRHRARFLPAGFNASYPGSFDSKFSSDFDFHLIRLVCAAFDVLPTSIGFTPNQGSGALNGSGNQQAGERVSQLQRATKPTAMWVTSIINEICTAYLDMPPELTFQFHGLDEDDEAREADLLGGYVGGGLKTINEGRDQLGLPRYDFPEADQPYLSTPTGPAFLNVAIQPVGLPGNLPSVSPDSRPAVEAGQARAAEPPAESAPVATEAEKVAEAATFRRWASRGSKGRQFALHHLTPDDLPHFGIDPDMVKAVDGGKAPGPHGPG